MSSDIKRKLEEEIHSLEKELREELPKALKIAASLGDLSENADYQAARERQDFVRVRLGQLKQRLADLSLINFDKIPRDRISLGSKVVLLDLDKNEEVTYKLVTSEDANVAAGLISTTSPIGRSLLNKREGDTVEVKIPSGTRRFEIINFTTMHDLKSDA
ncbi:MAG: transcription elongation factor GreA [Acidobacteria bacterium]|nr:MAG: transcription elongation factor GreA [Acidobacteriota bacterium]